MISIGWIAVYLLRWGITAVKIVMGIIVGLVDRMTFSKGLTQTCQESRLIC